MRPEMLSEALRYLGAGPNPDDALLERMAALAQELERRIIPRRIWRRLPLTRVEGVLTVEDLPLPGQSAERMLADCQAAAVMVCTLGADFDAWLRQTQRRDMLEAVMLDALGSAFIEATCDEAQRDIADRFVGLHLTDRFSPGYGDLPLDIQPKLLTLAGAQRVGVTLTPSMMMIPQKSVSALAGLSERPQPARIRGCAFCAMNASCTFRKAGKRCE